MVKKKKKKKEKKIDCSLLQFCLVLKDLKENIRQIIDILENKESIKW